VRRSSRSSPYKPESTFIAVSVAHQWPSTVHDGMPRSRLEETDVKIALINAQLSEVRLHEYQVAVLLSSVALKRRALEEKLIALEENQDPSNRLAMGLLIDIFLILLDTSPPLEFDALIDAVPLALSHVCRRWREISLGTPALWRRIVLHRVDFTHGIFTRRSSMTFFVRANGHPAELLYNERNWPVTDPGRAAAARSNALEDNRASHDMIVHPAPGPTIFSLFSALSALEITGRNTTLLETCCFLGTHALNTFRVLEYLSLTLADPPHTKFPLFIPLCCSQSKTMLPKKTPAFRACSLSISPTCLSLPYLSAGSPFLKR
jgi:hypothetical protein